MQKLFELKILDLVLNRYPRLSLQIIGILYLVVLSSMCFSFTEDPLLWFLIVVSIQIAVFFLIHLFSIGGDWKETMIKLIFLIPVLGWCFWDFLFSKKILLYEDSPKQNWRY